MAWREPGTRLASAEPGRGGNAPGEAARTCGRPRTPRDESLSERGGQGGTCRVWCCLPRPGRGWGEPGLGCAGLTGPGPGARLGQRAASTSAIFAAAPGGSSASCSTSPHDHR